jgi:glyoxylase-like metal-dependent hydrolase (beta-lactamase superfamily II)
VRHIVITHFDGDHIGGIPDFPEAQIHVTAAEALGAMRAPTRGERFRFRPVRGRTDPRSSNTPRTVRSGGDSPPPRSSPRCRRASR